MASLSVLRTKIKSKPSECMQTLAGESEPGVSFCSHLERLHRECEDGANMVIYFFTDSLIFASTQNTSPHPHLFSFHQQDFKAHFVSSATVPPSFSFPHSLQPSPTAGGEIISNTPSLFFNPPSHPPFLPSSSKLSATPSSASCLPSSPRHPFAASSACFSTQGLDL